MGMFMKKTCAFMIVLLVMLSGQSVGLAGDMLKEGLLLYYSFENANTKNVRDDSENGKTGVGENLVFAKGKVGNAAVFDGSSGITVSLGRCSSFSVAFYIKCQSIESHGGQICSNLSEDSNAVQIMYGYNGGGLRAEIDGFINSDPAFADTGIEINQNHMQKYNGKWVHVAVTYNNATFMRSIYLNGKLTATDKSASSLRGTISGDFSIGMRSGARYFTGMLDEFRVYNRALSAGEVELLFKQDGAALVNPGTDTTPTPTKDRETLEPSYTGEQATIEPTPPSVLATVSPSVTKPSFTLSVTLAPSGGNEEKEFPLEIVLVCVAIVVLAIALFLFRKRKPDHEEQNFLDED